MNNFVPNVGLSGLIADAIDKRHTLEVFYEVGVRMIEPHTLGFGLEGQILVRVFQTSGASASGEHANWKLFRVEKMSGVKATGVSFYGPRPGYRKGDSAMKRGIIAQL